jgi:DNA primase
MPDSFLMILDRVTIADILATVGIEPRRSRAVCPIHDGDNPTALSFTESVFHCFVCGVSGGLLDLAEQVWHCNRPDAYHRLCDMAGLVWSPHGTRARSSEVRTPAIIPVPRTNVALEIAQAELDRLEDQRRAVETALGVLNRAFTNGSLLPSDYYATDQLYGYELDELDAAIAIEKYELNQMKKKYEYDRRNRRG